MKRKILNKQIGIDDYGNALFKCHYTNKIVPASESIFLGAVIPQVTGSYVCSNDAAPVRKESVDEFNRTERNCNTCFKLKRVPHIKQHPQALMKGECLKFQYKTSITFHPEDCMNMPCWSERIKGDK